MDHTQTSWSYKLLVVGRERGRVGTRQTAKSDLAIKWCIGKCFSRFPCIFLKINSTTYMRCLNSRQLYNTKYLSQNLLLAYALLVYVTVKSDKITLSSISSGSHRHINFISHSSIMVLVLLYHIIIDVLNYLLIDFNLEYFKITIYYIHLLSY